MSSKSEALDIVTQVEVGGGHWGILETTKSKKKIIQNNKPADKTVKNQYNGNKWGMQSTYFSLIWRFDWNV